MTGSSLRRILLALCLAVPAWGAAQAAPPTLAFAPQFGDHMVLQRQMPLTIFGQAPAGRIVTVTLAGKSAKGSTNTKGNFSAVLPALEAGGPYVLTVTAGKLSKSLSDVLVGEVWIASGQSNMEWVLSSSQDPGKEYKRANLPSLRLFTQKQLLGSKPSAIADGTWMLCNAENAKGFSAVGYYFGKDLQNGLKVPVGIVCAAWGGSAGESWMTEKTLRSEKELKPIVDHWNAQPASLRRAWTGGEPVTLEFTDLKLIPKDGSKPKQVGEGDWTAWAKPGNNASFAWKGTGPTGRKVGVYAGKFQAAAWGGAGTPLADGKPQDLRPYGFVEATLRGSGVVKVELTQPSVKDYDYPSSQAITLTADWKTVRIPLSQFKQNGWGHAVPFTQGALDKIQFEHVGGDLPALPEAMFNGMVAPWARVAMRGAIWYQGETNSSRAEQYAYLLKALIGDWRRAWKEPGFAFLTVQLPNFNPSYNKMELNVWPEFREAQLASLDLPKTAVVTTIDVGDSHVIHPIRKAPVGDRLARAAMHVVYGKRGGLCPLYLTDKIEGNKVRLAFKNVESDLKSVGGKLKGFTIAGEDQKFVPAQARIEGDEVVVWAKAVPKPVAVRYGWADDPACNLYGKDGLPASPFRTDAWPLITAGRR